MCSNEMKAVFILVYLYRNKVFNQAQHFVHFNLCIALLLGLVTFVSGIEPASGYRVDLN